MMHPNPSTLALYAGQDLSWFARRRTERHLVRCSECSGEVQAFAAAHRDLVGLNELPALSWNRLSGEMKANIRLGVAAGECVRGAPTAGVLGWLGIMSATRTMAACAGLMALVAAGLFLERPRPATVPAIVPFVAGENAVLRATAGGIELNQGGQTLSLLHVRSADVTYLAGAQGSMRAGYVDSDTGNVTINNLYVQ
jgi:hypothetical protein